MAEEKNISLMSDGSFWLPGSYSTLSGMVDLLFNAIFWLSLILTIAIVGVTIYFSFKYKRSEKNQVAAKQIVHNNTVEFLWTFIPFVIVMAIFYWGFKDYLKLTVAPEDTMVVRVTGKKWLWTFEYPETGLKTVNEFVVPVGRAVKLIMSSEDVLHSFFVPNFRIKRDLVPNRYANVWFEATKTGRFQVFCTEFCGDAHSQMLADLIVMTEADYEDWTKNASFGDDVPLEELGKKLYKSKGCNACHSIDGSPKIGPTWKASYGRKRELATGEKVMVDDNYVRESIVYPGKKISKGYQNVMPAYAGLLNDREINAVIEYIKSLQ